MKHDLFFRLCSISFPYISAVQFSRCFYYPLDLCFARTQEHLRQIQEGTDKNTMKIKPCDASGISLFVAIASRAKLIAVTPRCTGEPAQSRLLIPAEMLPVPVLPVAPSLPGYQSPALLKVRV